MKISQSFLASKYGPKQQLRKHMQYSVDGQMLGRPRNINVIQSGFGKSFLTHYRGFLRPGVKCLQSGANAILKPHWKNEGVIQKKNVDHINPLLPRVYNCIVYIVT